MKKEWERAIKTGDAMSAQALLEDGAEINSKDRHGQSALMVASMKGHTELVRLLVGRGAELDTTAKYGLSALMLAVINNHAEIVGILRAAGANTEILGTGAPGFWNKTALDLAVSAGREEIARLLGNSGDAPHGEEGVMENRAGDPKKAEGAVGQGTVEK